MSDATTAATTAAPAPDATASATPAAPAATPAAAAPAATPAAAPAATPAAAPAAAAPAAEVKPEPIAYEFTAPEGVELDAAKVDGFKALAAKHNLSKEAAEEIFGFGAAQQTEMAKAMQSAVEAQGEKWAADTKADKEIGGDKLPATLAAASKALDKFCTPEFKQYLNDTKLGNHPEMVRLMYRVNQAISEDGFTPGRSSAQGRASTESVLYGSSAATNH